MGHNGAPPLSSQKPIMHQGSMFPIMYYPNLAHLRVSCIRNLAFVFQYRFLSQFLGDALPTTGCINMRFSLAFPEASNRHTQVCYQARMIYANSNIATKY